MKRIRSILTLMLALALMLPSLTAHAIDGNAGDRCPRSPRYTHWWGEWTIIVPSTCVTNGREEHTCRYCGKSQYRLAALGDHDWGEWETVRPATDTEPGLEQRVCKIEPSHIEEREIPPIGGDETPNPAISVLIAADPDAGEGKRYDGAWLTVHCKVTNTGNCPVYVAIPQNNEQGGRNAADPATYYRPAAEMNTDSNVILLNPGESCTDDSMLKVYPEDTQNGFVTAYVSGDYYYYEAETAVQHSATAESNTLVITLTYPANEAPVPAISVVISADADAGVGKRYEGAVVTYYFQVNNVGNCPVYVPWLPDLHSAAQTAHDASSPNGRTTVDGMGGSGATLLNPGEAYTQLTDAPVDAYDVQEGSLYQIAWDRAWYYDEAGMVQEISNYSNELVIPLTYPEGDDPVPDIASLLVVWKNDRIFDSLTGNDYYSMEPGVLAPDDDVYSYVDVINTGSVPLDVYTFVTFGDGAISELWNLDPSLAPGNSDEDCWAVITLGDHLTPGTDTGDLLGTVTLTIAAIGRDPQTGEELCLSNGVSRTWQVGRPTPTDWIIPEESDLQVILYESSISENPAGYQWMEEWNTGIAVENVGPVDVEGYTLHVGFLSSLVYIDSADYDATDSATWYEKSFTNAIAASSVDDLYFFGPFGRIMDDDVTRGYVSISAYATWIDPDSGAERQSATSALSLPVISDTGLLLEKSVKNAPAMGPYFTKGEIVEWELTVTNNSAEPLYNVNVIDQGMTVGQFDVIYPGETRECIVPGYEITEYDAEVGAVYNQAYAAGLGLDGAWHYYHSNMVTALTGKKGNPDPDTGVPVIIPGTGKDDFCSLTLNTLGHNEIHYTLHACTDHIEAARQAEGASAAEAAAIWRAEIDKLYQQLCDAAQTGALTLVINDEDAFRAYATTPDAQAEALALVQDDQAAFQAYADAYEALYGEEALADMLRLRCAELCCMLHTAPSALPDSILGIYATLESGEQYDACQRVFGPMNGSDSKVTVKLNADLGDTMAQALATVRGTRRYAAAHAFMQAQAQWQMALDKAVNAAYKAADKDARKAIAACRKQLDQLLAARKALLTALYPDTSDTVQEVLANLYRDAAIDANLKK